MSCEFYLNTKYYFGKNVVNNYLSKEIKNRRFKKIFLLYGGGSIKKNGIYDSLIKSFKKAKVEWIEHFGIKPNPVDIDTYNAALKGRKNKIDLIIAVGGGSVIDEAKVVAALITNTQYKSCWDYVRNRGKIITHKPIPVFSIVTLAATGSENNYNSVITNSKTNDKWGLVNSERPIICFEDPTYTYSVNKWQTGSGAFDIFSHLLENYYSINQHFSWTKQYIIGNLKNVLKYAPIVLKHPNNYEARANLLWTSSFSLNGLSAINTDGGDWKVHGLEHAISGRWDVSHGAGLALITPIYIKYMAKKSKKFYQLSLELAKELFNVNTIPAYIKKIEQFIKLLGMPTKYTDFKQINEITPKDLNWLSQAFDKNTPGYHKLGVDIYKLIKV